MSWMSLDYDFDIVAIVPDQANPEHGRTATAGRPAVRALFRDVKTADALRAASPKIRRIFQESGFSLETRDQQIARGYYASEDTEDRELILKRLFANIRDMGVQGEYSGEFDIHRFLDHVRTAKPCIAATRRQPSVVKPRRPAPVQPKRRTVQGRIGFALGFAVILFVALKYLAEKGAAP